MTTRISYSIKDAAEATGISVDIIKRAIRSGDLKTHRPVVAKREIAKDFIAHIDLERWATGKTAEVAS